MLSKKTLCSCLVMIVAFPIHCHFTGEAPGKEFLKMKFHACMCFCDLQCVWSPSGKTSLKITGLPLLRRHLSRSRRSPVISRPPQSGWQALRTGPGSDTPTLSPWGHGLGEWGSPSHKALTCGKQGNSVVTWLFRSTCSVLPQKVVFRLIFLAGLLHARVFWGDWSGQCSLGGVCVQWCVCRASSW